MEYTGTIQQGFDYEKKAARVGKKYGIVPKNFKPAGSTGDKPDLMIEHKNAQTGCELKITTASAGSLILKYDIQEKKRPWKFNEVDKKDKEKVFIHEVAEEIGLFDILAKKWKTAPLKFLPSTLKMGQKYAADYKTFKEVNGEIPGRFLEGYYNKKNTFYVNVGTHGFYQLGNKNPLGLYKVPLFSNSAKTMYRCRVQPKGGGNYQFIFEMNFYIPASYRSQYNIAPLKGRHIKILEDQMDLSCFQ